MKEQASRPDDSLDDGLPRAARGRLRNILGNLGWLLGGKGFGAVCSLIYLSILARSLGLRDFGHYSLIFGAAQAVVAIAGFQTWQSVIRFGSKHLKAGKAREFRRLALFCSLLDALGALTGCLLAAIIFYGFAGALNLNPNFVDMSFMFVCVLLWARTTTPYGVLRALDRFDVTVMVESIVPLGRLIAAIAIWAISPSVLTYLIAWALIDMVGGLACWISAWCLAPRPQDGAGYGNWRDAVEENPGLLRFLGTVYVATSLDAVVKQGPLLAVGALLSVSAAGIYRLADQIAQGLGKLSALLARASYAEITHAYVAVTHDQFRRLIGEVTGLATVAGLFISLLAFVAGGWVLQVMGGESFLPGTAVLLPLAIGASLELAAIAFEPVLHSADRAILTVVARLSAIAVAAALILLLEREWGAPGIAWSVVAGYLVSYLGIAISAWAIIVRRKTNLLRVDRSSAA